MQTRAPNFLGFDRKKCQCCNLLLPPDTYDRMGLDLLDWEGRPRHRTQFDGRFVLEPEFAHETEDGDVWWNYLQKRKERRWPCRFGFRFQLIILKNLINFYHIIYFYCCCIILLLNIYIFLILLALFLISWFMLKISTQKTKIKKNVYNKIIYNY